MFNRRYRNIPKARRKREVEGTDCELRYGRSRLLRFKRARKQLARESGSYARTFLTVNAARESVCALSANEIYANSARNIPRAPDQPPAPARKVLISPSLGLSGDPGIPATSLLLSFLLTLAPCSFPPDRFPALERDSTDLAKSRAGKKGLG